MMLSFTQKMATALSLSLLIMTAAADVASAGPGEGVIYTQNVM